MAFVYLIGENNDNNNYKIGVTKHKDINSRISELQTGNSNELYIKDYYETKYPYKLEKMLHRHFFDKRIINEWFSLNSDDIKSFKDVCEKYNNVLDSLKYNPFFNENKRATIF